MDFETEAVKLHYQGLYASQIAKQLRITLEQVVHEITRYWRWDKENSTGNYRLARNRRL